jgi:hypothetical protein
MKLPENFSCLIKYHVGPCRQPFGVTSVCIFSVLWETTRTPQLPELQLAKDV